MRKVIIDTDCGLDDAMAIMLALSLEDVDVLAITCITGNTHVDNVVRNVFLTLKACDKLKVPVYKGAAFPLMGKYSGPCDFHGQDGFGDVYDHNVNLPEKKIETKCAAEILVELTDKHAGEISLILLGPVTNAALALRISSTFAQNIKDVFIMGGNTEGLGNTTTSAEANFYADPEAAFIVLNEMRCPITIVPWELCLRNFISWDCREKLLNTNSSCAQLITCIENGVKEKSSDFPGYILCDQFAVAVALIPNVVRNQSEPVYVTVELNGCLTRGQMIIDSKNFLQKQTNVTIIKEIHMDVFTDMLGKALSK